MRIRAPLASLAVAAMLASGCGAYLATRPSESAPRFDEDVLPYFRRHCLRCHGEAKQRAGFRIDDLSRDFANGSSVDRWLEVIERINSAEMPPEDEPDRPSAEESARVVAWLAARIREGDASRLAKRGRISFHRLSREEYANTIYDLLGVHFDVADRAGLNADDVWHGFERIGSVLSLSPSHVEKYFAAAEAILAEAYPDTAADSVIVRSSAVDLVGGPSAYGTERFRELESSGRADEIRVDLWPGQRVRAKPAGLWVRRSGRYRIRAQVSGLRSRLGRAPHLVIHATGVDRLLFERDIVTPEDEPIIVEFDAHLPVGQHEFSAANDVPGPLLFSRLGRSGGPFFSIEEGRLPWQLQMKDETGAPVYPVLMLDWIEWEGPLVADAELERDRYLPSTTVDVARALPGLARFAERAFRRPLRAGELERYAALAESEVAAGEDVRSAIETSMLAILCSADFLYLAEGSPDREASELSDWELASRLSYFLWSTMPDDELFGLARDGTIGDPEVLRSQVARMLADPRAARFADAFPRQWLQLDRVGMFPPDSELYPDYDEHLERSMVRETTAFFGAVLNENLTLREFLVSDWTIVNPRLALHYGLQGITEDRFQRATLARGDHRGGILTHASVLSLTSDGTRHRPVHRGVWIMESIFGESPPPPPASVEPIEPIPVDGRKMTFRQQLEAHRADPSCAACHRKIDPLGLAFENYDAIGRWRTEETVETGTGADPEVDASGTLPDGRSFSNAREFQRLLLGDIDRFNTAFVEKLATFALRRTMAVDDRDLLARIAAESKRRDYRLRDIVDALVLSDLFKRR